MGRRKLRFERIASTAVVRTRRNLGIIQTLNDIDGDRETIVTLVSKLASRKCELDIASRQESFASRCETLLLLG